MAWAGMLQGWPQLTRCWGVNRTLRAWEGHGAAGCECEARNSGGKGAELGGGCEHWSLILSTSVCGSLTGGVTAPRAWSVSISPHSRQCPAGNWLSPRSSPQGPFHGQCLASLPTLSSFLACGFSADLYYFSKHPQWNKFLQPREPSGAQRDRGLLLGGCRFQGCPGGRQDVQDSSNGHLSVSRTHQDLEPIFVNYICPFL